MLRWRSLGSGSSGNATLVEAGDGSHITRVLIDCGLGLRVLAQRLAAAGLSTSDLDAIFITHEHGDHIGCALPLAQREQLPLWMSHGTHAAIGSPAADGLLREARDGLAIAIGALCLLPFTVPHDAREPLQLVVTDGDRRLGVLTDLGHVSAHVRQAMSGCHALQLECNHDPELLARSAYPPFLRQRIAGPHGHLANAEAAALLAELAHDRLGPVVAAHLSEQNNTPELARAALAGALGCAAGDILVADAAGGTDWLTA